MADCNEIFEFINSQKENMINTLKEFVSIPSIKSESAADMPYGENVLKALNFISSKANEFGLKTENFENKIRIARYGDGEDKLGILCHTDVVGVNADNWQSPPFEPAIRDNMLYGRGSLDNKGPTVAALFALYALKECGVKLKNKTSLFFGSDEESGMHDFKDYLKKYKLPQFAFAPDACFPVGISETGAIRLCWKTQFSCNKILSVHSGSMPGIVPESAVAVIKTGTIENMETVLNGIPDIKYLIEKSKETIKITVFGKSTHTAHPQCGINALTALLKLLSVIDEKSTFSDLATIFPHGAFYGEGCGIEQGKIVVSLTKLDYENGQLAFTADCRVTVGENAVKLAEIIQKKISLPVNESSIDEPHYVSPDSYLVKILSGVYTECTGRTDAPYPLDAMTYAHLKNDAVIFGGVKCGDNSCNAHSDDECYNLDTLVLAAKMFAKAMIEICK